MKIGHIYSNYNSKDTVNVCKGKQKDTLIFAISLMHDLISASAAFLYQWFSFLGLCKRRRIYECQDNSVSLFLQCTAGRKLLSRISCMNCYHSIYVHLISIQPLNHPDYFETNPVLLPIRSMVLKNCGFNYTCVWGKNGVEKQALR